MKNSSHKSRGSWLSAVAGDKDNGALRLSLMRSGKRALTAMPKASSKSSVFD